MNKDSLIFKVMCLTVCLMLCVSSIAVFAEEAPEAEDETVSEAVEEIASEPDEAATDAEDATDAEEPTEEETEGEEEREVLDLYAATLRDNGIYVTPTDTIAAAFTYGDYRYVVPAGSGNNIRLDGFESDVEFTSEDIASNARHTLQATGAITPESAHSGYFGFSVTGGKFVYRTSVTQDMIYVFSAWMKNAGDGISDAGRVFTVSDDSGNSYNVGYNEIGRGISATGDWQQVIFTFKAPISGLFAIDFEYRGRTPLMIDDIELYEAELFFNPLEITDVECTDADGNAYSYADGFTTSGTLTHSTTFYNSDVDDVYYKAVMVLYKDGIMIDCQIRDEMALLQDETTTTFSINIPEDDDVSKYSYVVFFVNESDATNYYGQLGDIINPCVVKGK